MINTPTTGTHQANNQQANTMPNAKPSKQSSSKRTQDGEEKPTQTQTQPTEDQTVYTCITCQQPVQDNAIETHRRAHLDEKRHMQIRKQLQIYDSTRGNGFGTPLELTDDDKLISGRYQCTICGEGWRKCERDAADRHSASAGHRDAVKRRCEVMRVNRHRVVKSEKGRVPVNRCKRVFYQSSADEGAVRERTPSKKQKKA